MLSTDLKKEIYLMFSRLKERFLLFVDCFLLVPDQKARPVGNLPLPTTCLKVHPYKRLTISPKT